MLKSVRKLINDWGIFILSAILLNYLVLSGKVAQKPIIDSEFSGIVQFFQVQAANYGVSPDFNNLTMSFVEKLPKKNWIGLCQSTIASPSRFLSIHKAYFMHTTPEQQYTLVIHELGHCTLGRDHVEGYLPNGCPKSIMHPSDGLFGCFFKDQDYYLRELFGKAL
jgi:hypothetical protein